MITRGLVTLAALTVLGTAVSGSAPVAASPKSPTADVEQPAFYTPPRQNVLYGHIKALTRRGVRYELRFDPAWWLGGTTANRAAIEDKVIAPGDVVPNDYYVRDETHRLLTYRVPANARATVLTGGRVGGLRSTSIRIPELAQIVRGRNPNGRRLYVPGNRLGFRIRVAVDTVRSLDQQYQP